MMDPALVLGPYGAVVLLLASTIHLYKENTALRRDSMDLLRKYQEREDEERKLRVAEEQRRREREVRT
jgi:hypothetical protein